MGVASALGIPPVGQTVFRDSLEGGPPACVAADPGIVPVDVRSIVVHPVFLHNGAPFGNDPLESAQFFLQAAGGKRFLLGTTSEPPADVRVLPGVYDVLYDWRAGDSVPRNKSARVAQALVLDGETTLTLDMPSFVADGAATLNGDPFPAFEEGFGDLALVGVHGMGEIALGGTDQNGYGVRVLPGAYRLRYRGPGSGTAVPANENALLARADLDDASSPADFDVKAHLHTFSFALNGAAFPNSVYDHGTLSLRGPGGDRVTLGASEDQSGQHLVIDGRYDANWELLAGGTMVPSNVDSAFDRVTLTATAAVALDVPAVTVNGAIDLNGDDPPASAYEYGRLFLRDRGTGADTFLGDTKDLGYSRRVIPARYDLRYALMAGGGIVPENVDALVQSSILFDSFFGPAIDLPAGGLQFTASLDGVDFPATVYEHGRLDARAAFDAAGTPMANTDELAGVSASVRLLAGPYATVYTRLAGSGTVPEDEGAALPAGFTIVAGTINLVPVPFAFTSDEFEFHFTHNGAPFANGASPKAAFSLRGYSDADAVALGTTMDAPGPRRLVTNGALKIGRRLYVVYDFQAGAFGAASIPRNLDTPVACVGLQ